jgi:hypothetical protein
MRKIELRLHASMVPPQHDTQGSEVWISAKTRYDIDDLGRDTHVEVCEVWKIDAREYSERSKVPVMIGGEIQCLNRGRIYRLNNPI